MSVLPKTAAVLGGGAVGQVLVAALNRAGIRVVLAWNRSEQRGWQSDLEGIGGAELIFLSVADAAVEEVCTRIAPLLRRGHLVAHCAGALGLDALRPALEAGARTGSLHPLRAIPRGSAAGALRDAAAGVAGSDAEARETLQQVARALGMSPIPVGDGSRVLYHAAAVLAAGGQVALFARAVQAFQDATGAPEPIARAALLPLARGALEALEHRSPSEALTGPVARGDVATVQAHRAALDGETLSLYDQLVRAMLELRPSPEIGSLLRTPPGEARPAAGPGSRSSPPRPRPPREERPSASSRSPAPRARPLAPPRRGRAPRRKR
ncbi:MAG TPA: DUF2520 domain-containing protein [Myxococcales bacterium]|nr:DUF2520 domain-containing protein [Myxococcales bacterium]